MHWLHLDTFQTPIKKSMAPIPKAITPIKVVSKGVVLQLPLEAFFLYLSAVTILYFPLLPIKPAS
ncbi:hypothetical protein ABIE50_001843 [Chitinophaga sp. OAE865]